MVFTIVIYLICPSSHGGVFFQAVAYIVVRRHFRSQIDPVSLTEQQMKLIYLVSVSRSHMIT